MTTINTKAMGLIIGILLILILQHSFPNERSEKILNELRPVLESEIVSEEFYSGEEVRAIIEEVITTVIEELDLEYANEESLADRQIVNYWNEIIGLKAKNFRAFWIGTGVGVGTVSLIWLFTGVYSWIKTVN